MQNIIGEIDMSKVFNYLTNSTHTHVGRITSYDDLMEGFYDSNDLLELYPYLANIENPIDTIGTQYTKRYQVYVRMIDTNIPQLWIEVARNYKAKVRDNVFRFGSKNDPAPTLIRTSSSEADVTTNRRSSITVATFGATAGYRHTANTHIVNCQFNSGVYGYIQPKSSRSHLDGTETAIFEDCYFTTENDNNITLLNVTLIGKSVVTTEYELVEGSSPNDADRRIVMDNVKYSNAKFYIGGAISFKNEIYFDDSEQTYYHDPIYKRECRFTEPGLSMGYTSAIELSTHYIKLMPEIDSTKHMIIANRTKFISINVPLYVSCSFTDCVIEKTLTTDVEISSSCIINCTIIDGGHDFIKFNKNFIKNTILKCNVGAMYDNYFGQNNSFNQCFVRVPNRIINANARLNYILCDKGGSLFRMSVSILDMEGMIERNNGVLDMSILESDTELLSIIDNVLAYPDIISIFGYRLSYYGTSEIVKTLMPIIVKHAGVADKTKLRDDISEFFESANLIKMMSKIFKEN